MELLILLPVGILVLAGTFVLNYINKTLDQKLDTKEKELTNYFELKVKELNEKIENIVIDPSSVVVDLKPIEEKINKNAESIVYLTDKKVNNDLFNIKISELIEDIAETNTKLEVLKDLEETVMNVTEEANEELSNKIDDIILDINDFKDTTQRNFQDTNNLIDASATEVDMLSRQAEDFQQLHLDSQATQSELDNRIKNTNDLLKELWEKTDKEFETITEGIRDALSPIRVNISDLSSSLGAISEEVLPSIEGSIQNNSQLINTNIENIKTETEKLKGAIEEIQELKISSQDNFNNITTLNSKIESGIETLETELNKTDDKIATAIKTDNETRDASDNQKIIEEVSGIVTNLFKEAGIGGEGSDVGNTVEDVLNELNNG